jgi:hypothetical protein
MWQCPNKVFRMPSTLAADAYTKAVLHPYCPVQQTFSKDPLCEYTQHSLTHQPRSNPVMVKYICTAYALLCRGEVAMMGEYYYYYYHYMHNRNALLFAVYIFSCLFWIPLIFFIFFLMHKYIICIMYV